MLKPAGEKIVQEVEEHTFKILIKNLTSFNDDDLEAFIKTARQMDTILNIGEKE